MNIRKKLIVLFLIGITIFTTRFVIEKFSERRILLSLFKDEVKRKGIAFNKILSLKRESLETLARDYTYWDDMVNFVNVHPDKKWAQENIDTVISTFKVNAVWIYKTDNSLVYSVNDIHDGSLKEIPLSRDDILKLFVRERFRTFFIKTRQGIMEIAAATIHATADPERKTDPQGYFFAGRLWSKDYCAELGNLIEGTVTKNFAEKESDSAQGRFSPDTGTIKISHSLNGWDNSQVGKIDVLFKSARLAWLNTAYKEDLIVTIAIYLIIGIILLMIVMSWFYIPLDLISKALFTQKDSLLAGLKNKKDEFGEISRLISKSILDKAQLIQEISERKEAQLKLKTSFDELREAQVKLVQSEKLASLGRMTAAIAHELNNPLSYVLSNVTTIDNYISAMSKVVELYHKQSAALREGNSEESAAQEAALDKLKEELDFGFILKDVPNLLSETREGVQRLKNIIQDLKVFSRSEKLDKTPADINACIESTLRVLWNEVKYKVDVVKEFSALPSILCYPQQLSQVFMNLIFNAVDAIGEHGTIAIKTYERDKNIFIEIADTGVGIPQENLSRLFEPFFTTKDPGKGTGLGLSIAREIIKKHAGEINVTSKLGQGTTFIIRIPTEEAKA